MTKVLVVLGLLLIRAGSADADVLSDLQKSYNRLTKGYSNYTAPSVYQGQQAGHYTGGSLYLRSAARNQRFFSVTPPSINVGCNGIDIFMGSFSMINSDQLIAMAKNIGANALSYAFYLSLDTLCPMCKTIIGQLQKMANFLNKMQIDSCNVAMTIGKSLSLSERKRKADTEACSGRSAVEGTSQDYAEGKKNCKRGFNAMALWNKLSSNPSDPASARSFQPSTNIAWEVIKTMADTSTDKQLGYFMMTLSGTIIIRPPCSTGQTAAACANSAWIAKAVSATSSKITLAPPPKADHHLVNAILYGTQLNTGNNGRKKMPALQIYTCQEIGGSLPDKCLFLARQPLQISEQQSIKYRVRQSLLNIVKKLKNDRGGAALTRQEKALLSQTSIPVLKLLTVHLAYNEGSAYVAVDKYAELIAMDYLRAYLQGVVNQLKAASGYYQIQETVMNKYRKLLGEAESRLMQVMARRRKYIIDNIQLVQEVQLLERAVISSLSPGLAGSLRFTRSLRRY